jgi:ATP-binding cassette subfamily F protein uup
MVLATKPNLLVLDEPTNDFDVPTLELSEELIAGFGGTLLLVSHDREFLDNVVTSILVCEGDGRWSEHVGGYSDWRARRDALERDAVPARAAKVASIGKPAPAVRKLTYPEAHELSGLPDRIEALEAEHGALAAPMADPAFFKLPQERQQAARAELARVDAELSAAMARWEELESRR